MFLTGRAAFVKNYLAWLDRWISLEIDPVKKADLEVARAHVLLYVEANK